MKTFIYGILTISSFISTIWITIGMYLLNVDQMILLGSLLTGLASTFSLFIMYVVRASNDYEIVS